MNARANKSAFPITKLRIRRVRPPSKRMRLLYLFAIVSTIVSGRCERENGDYREEEDDYSFS